jgi:hypothetical protein
MREAAAFLYKKLIMWRHNAALSAYRLPGAPHWSQS